MPVKRNIPVTCSWAQTPVACAEGRCRSPWKVSGAGFLLQAARLGWVAERYLAVPRCHGLDALLCWGPSSRRLATSWGGGCRSTPASVTSKPTVQIPLSTAGRRRDYRQNISQLWRGKPNERLWVPGGLRSEKVNRLKCCGPRHATVPW